MEFSLEDLSQEKLKTLHEDHEKAFEQAKTLNSIQEHYENNIRTLIENHHHLKEIRQNAALTIQRCFRGHYQRLIHNDKLSDLSRNTHFNVLRELQELTDHCLLTVGSTTVDFVIILQRSIRKFLFKVKIARLQRCYNSFIQAKIEAASSFLHPHISSWLCKIKLEIFKWETFKENTFTKVRRRLAVLTVKKVWRLKKLTARKMKQRLVVWRRNKIAQRRKEEFAKMMEAKKKRRKKKSTVKESKKVEEKPPEIEPEESVKLEVEEELIPNENLEENQENQEISKQEEEGTKEEEEVPIEENPSQPVAQPEVEEEETEEERLWREKMDMLKVSYGVRDFEEKLLLPVLHKEEEEQEEESDEEEFGWFRKRNKDSIRKPTEAALGKTAYCWESKGLIQRNTIISSPPHLQSRTAASSLPPLSHIPPHTISRETPKLTPVKPVSDEHFLESTEIETIRTQKLLEEIMSKTLPIPKKTPPRKIAPISKKLLASTYSTDQKLHERFSRSTPKPWVPSPRLKESYLPGLENTAYSPKKWSPLPCNINSLAKTVYLPNSSWVSSGFPRSSEFL